MATKNIRFYTVEKLGRKQSLTPEGYLLCEAVPVARTGQMIYGPDETPIEAGPEGFVRIDREEDEVFRPETLASYVGKSVTNDHPPEDVKPENWKDYEVGVVLNPRRGVGAEDDLLICDLLIKDPEAIEAVRDGKREVSVGYDADYEEIASGRGRQHNIIVNHVALVEEGRCGPRCAIGDRKPSLQSTEKRMTTKVIDLLRRAFKAKDEKELEDIAKDAAGELDVPENHIHVHVPLTDPKAPGTADTKDDDHESRLSNLEEGHQKILEKLDELGKKIDGGARDSRDNETEEEKKAREEAEKKAKDAKDAEEKIEDDLEEEAPEGTQDKARKARDSVYLEDSYRDTVALAEILTPGIRIPTFDRAADPKKSLDGICSLRRSALDLAYAVPETRGFIDEANGGKAFDLKNMSCGAVRTLFRSVAAMKKAANNGRRSTGDLRSASSAPLTLAELNKRNREKYKA